MPARQLRRAPNTRPDETATTEPADKPTPSSAARPPDPEGTAEDLPVRLEEAGITGPFLRPVGQAPVVDSIIGLLTIAIVFLTICNEWVTSSILTGAKLVTTAALIAALAVTVTRGRSIFVLVGIALTAGCMLIEDDWHDTIFAGLTASAFVASFFAALCTLRVAADSSPGIRRCGRFLAQQPPGRRYLALTAGGQLFALLLNYGAIALLGSLATASARDEPNEEIRKIRVRRMLLAIQRALVSILPWSPLSFAVAITTTLLPDTNWGDAFLPAFISGLMLAGIGYALDTIVKPRVSGPRPPLQVPEENWRSLWPLLALLLLMITVAGTLHFVTGIRIVGLVILIVPVVSLLWVALQARRARPLAAVVGRSVLFTTHDLPSYRGELTLLMMAAYIGTVGAHIALPAFSASGLHITNIPTPVLLVLLVWLVPLCGQFGMNPILAVSLFGPLLPSAAELGVSQTAVLLSLTGGWAITAATSPFTASTLLIGTLSGNTALHVGLKWNGVYALLCATALSAWVLIYAYVF